jgi:hypothetical protein
MKIVALPATDTLRRLDDLSLLLRDATAHGASLGFTLPLDAAVLERYWRDLAGCSSPSTIAGSWSAARSCALMPARKPGIAPRSSR